MPDERVILSDCFTCKELALVGLIDNREEGSGWPGDLLQRCEK